MTEYIFIVGLPRTGTKLMMNIFTAARPQRCCISPENFFLGRAFLPGVRRKLNRYGDLSVTANVERLVDAMLDGEFHGEYWDRLRKPRERGGFGVSREQLTHALLQSDRSPRAIYATLLQLHAPAGEEVIWGDKSGPHLYQVPTMLAWFPNAKVIHTFRDPRAILASELRKRLKQHQRHIASALHKRRVGQALARWLATPLVSLGIVLYITVAWLRAARLHEQYKRRYPHNYHLSKFEDLVAEPAQQVSALCDFLGVAFDPAMLQPPTVDSSFERSDNTGFDQKAVTRWQHSLQPWMQQWLCLWAGRSLKKFGYV